jgi:hypothetical protein
LLFPLALARVLAFLAYLLALAAASTGRSAIVYAYMSGLLVEVGLLSRFHDSLGDMVGIVLLVQALTLSITAAALARSYPRKLWIAGWLKG